MAVISVAGLRKAYGRLTALDDVNFEVQRGEVFALLGPNGAGKTTCIEILEGFLSRDGGDVRVLDVDPGRQRDQTLLRERLGVVLQELAVEPFFTVRQVLRRNAGFYSHPRDVEEVLDVVDLTDKADTTVKRLSGGQQRRLDIGLGIIGRPELLFLDEPTTGLDPNARRTTWELIRTLASEGTTVLLSSHYMDEVEALAHRVAVLSRGRLVALSSPGSLGGRDRGQVAIRFTLAAGVDVSSLPVRPTSLEGSRVQIVTDDEIVVVNEITNWALSHRVGLSGFEVRRTTLDDVYLSLTSAPDDEARA
jgi:ABC-2 type transport system ATP-binding protein